MSSNGPPQQPQQVSQPVSSASNNIITALTTVLKSSGAETVQHDRIATLLLQNMPQLSELAKQGKLNQQQILQLKEFADKNKSIPSQPVASTSKPAQPIPTATPTPAATQIASSAINAFKSSSPAPTLASLAPPTGGGLSNIQPLNVVNPGPQEFPSASGRPTLSGGIVGGRITGTPGQIKRTYDISALGPTDGSARPRKDSASDQSMRRSIQDLVFSIDPNVKIDPEVEDLLLEIADEFIDSVTNFGCRLAKHRGGDSLEVRDLQLHLERNHNIRIPGFASDETRISISQSNIAPLAGTVTSSSGKKNAQNANVTLRSQRLAQVAQAKKDAKLM